MSQNPSDELKNFFSTQLLSWHQQENERQLPWKETQNPYFIWLAEIILQQTRVEQGTPYYEKFITQYPTVTDLANAPEDEVLKLWQGLGYYSRARNLHLSAQHIRDHYQGIFPDKYDAIRALKGVGDYTAAAIASFAFQLPYAVVDGNVYRVLSRFFDIKFAIDQTSGKKYYAHLAQDLLCEEEAADYNQAIMDLGATVCKPRNPDCSSCPMQSHCLSRQAGNILDRPIKSKKLKKRTRYFYYLCWNAPTSSSIILHKRPEKDIWTGLYDFPLIELEAMLPEEQLHQLWEHQQWSIFFDGAPNIKPIIKQQSKFFKQTLSHQQIYACFLQIEAPIPDFFDKKVAFIMVEPKNLKNFAVPKIVQNFLEDQQLRLF